jgi:hypothetical protein
MRRYLPAFVLALAIAPFPLAGCDLINKLKGGGEDAGLDAAAAADAAEDVAPPPAPTEDAATPAPTTTLTAVPTTTVVRPVVVADAGTDARVSDAAAPVDAGSATVDAGGPAPVPTPTLKFPNIKLDGGAFKLPKMK